MGVALIWTEPYICEKEGYEVIMEELIKSMKRLVMKSTWEEKVLLEVSPPSEVEVLHILLKVGAQRLPQPYNLDSAIVRDDDNMEVVTCRFPNNGQVALPATSTTHMKEVQSSYTSSETSKSPSSSRSGGRLLFQQRVQPT